LLAAVMVAVSAAFCALFYASLPAEAAMWQRIIAVLSAAVLGGSLYGFAVLFSRETLEQRKIVEEFFKKLDTPVDVAKEVFGAGRKQISTFPLVGGTTIVMGLLMSLIFLTGMTGGEAVILGVIVGIMILFGALMWYFGKKSEIRSAAQYSGRHKGE
jgi:hypothetical protein